MKNHGHPSELAIPGRSIAIYCITILILFIIAWISDLQAKDCTSLSCDLYFLAALIFYTFVPYFIYTMIFVFITGFVRDKKILPLALKYLCITVCMLVLLFTAEFAYNKWIRHEDLGSLERRMRFFKEISDIVYYAAWACGIALVLKVREIKKANN